MKIISLIRVETGRTGSSAKILWFNYEQLGENTKIIGVVDKKVVYL